MEGIYQVIYVKPFRYLIEKNCRKRVLDEFLRDKKPAS